MKRRVLALTAATPLAALALATPASAATSGQMYRANLHALNNQGASGSLSLTLNGDQVTVTEHVSGLASMFNGAPFPHVQHIHGGAKGTCPTMAEDANGDGVISTPEAAGSYGGILTTLSVGNGGTTPADGTNVKIAPSGSSFDYSRTITVSAATVNAIKNGNAVIVVHGDDPSKLPAKAQKEMSDIPGTSSLPLAATAPALCGALMAMPSGAAATGGGSTAGLQDGGLLAVGGVALAGAAVAFGYRRRTQSQL